MVTYYNNLRSGAGRAEALRSIQRKMINAPISAGKQNRGLSVEKKPSAQDRTHPFYWASFIVSGNWRPIDETIAR
jgi:CHAT domain-containing protein